MLTAEMIRAWVQIYAPMNDHALAAMAQRDPFVAKIESQGLLIEDLIARAKIVKNGLAARSFEEALHERIARETRGPEAAQAIWDAASLEEREGPMQP